MVDWFYLKEITSSFHNYQLPCLDHLAMFTCADLTHGSDSNQGTDCIVKELPFLLEFQECAHFPQFVQNFSERQILWSSCSVDFQIFTLPIQTLHSKFQQNEHTEVFYFVDKTTY